MMNDPLVQILEVGDSIRLSIKGKKWPWYIEKHILITLTHVDKGTHVRGRATLVLENAPPKVLTDVEVIR